MAGPTTFSQALAGMRANPNRKLSVGEIMSQRERGPQASAITDPRTGKRLTKEEAAAVMPQGGFKVNVLGSVGFDQPRSPIHGYSFNKQGTAADYVRRNGGLSPQRPSLLNELYRNQPGVTMGAWDQLQQQQRMDKQDPIGAFYADQAGVAQGAGEYDKAQMMHDFLQDHLAQKAATGTVGTTGTSGTGSTAIPADATSAAMGGQSAPGSAQEFFYPGQTKYDASGNLWRWNDRERRGEMISKGPTMEDVTQPPNTTWVPDENLGEGTLYTPYGTASVAQADRPTTGPQGAFNNAQGSAGAGMQFTGPEGRQSAQEFFQGAANRQGVANKYAVPEPGYGGHPFSDSGWNAYNSAMQAKKLLGKR